MKYDSDYSIRLKMVEQMGGDVTKKYDSVYSIDLEILRLMENGGGGGGGTSSKIVRISKDWYNNQDNYQTEIKKALDDIYNEVSNNRSVTVVFDGFRTQADNWVFETSNVVALNANDVIVFALGWDKSLLQLRLMYDEGSNHSSLDLDDRKLAQKNEIYLPYVYTDGRMNLDANEGRISEFISEPTVDNEEFVVLKTTVPAFEEGIDIHRSYKAFNFYGDGSQGNYGETYLLSRFGGMKLFQDEYNANFDLIPDGEWYVIFGDIGAATYRRIIVTKSIRNVDGSLDVYLGFKGIDINGVHFWDCTTKTPDAQGNESSYNETNWILESASQRISVDSFIGRRTRYFCTTKEGVKVDRLVLFKRMK